LSIERSRRVRLAADVFGILFAGLAKDLGGACDTPRIGAEVAQSLRSFVLRNGRQLFGWLEVRVRATDYLAVATPRHAFGLLASRAEEPGDYEAGIVRPTCSIGLSSTESRLDGSRGIRGA